MLGAFYALSANSETGATSWEGSYPILCNTLYSSDEEIKGLLDEDYYCLDTNAV
jgi:hypothetical protein